MNQKNRMIRVGIDLKFKTAVLRSSLCGYDVAYILVKGIITITGEGDNDAAND